MNIKALVKSLLNRQFATLLLIVQLALTLGLVVNSTMMALDTQERLDRQVGFAKEELAVIRLLPTSSAFLDEAYYRSVLHQDIAALQAIPGIKSVSQLNQLPIQRGGWNGSVHKVNDEEILKTNRSLNFVPYYYSNFSITQTLGLQLLEGRLFDEHSPQSRDQETEDVIITESLAKVIFGDQSPIGEELNSGFVIGVVSDFMTWPHVSEERQYAVFYNEDLAIPDLTQSYLIRLDDNHTQEILAAAQEAILKVNPERDILKVITMTEHHREYFQQDIGLVGLFTMLCILMLVVTAISSFAHAQFHVSRQKRQIGIRRALGATRRDIILHVLSENWLVTLLGSLVGIGFVIAINIGLSTQIEISKPDSLIYLGAFIVILISGTLATWLPAFRTSLVPPVIATRTV